MQNTSGFYGVPAKLDPSMSTIWVTTPSAGGHGSAGTSVRLYTIIKQRIGDAAEYFSDAVGGDLIRIKRAGRYCIEVQDIKSSGTGVFGVTINSKDFTTVVNSLSSDIAVAIASQAGGFPGRITTELNLNAGDVVRCQDQGDMTEASGFAYLKVSLVRAF